MPQNLEETAKKTKYSLDFVLQQLGGYEYYDKNIIYYIYHTLNEDFDIAKMYKEMIDETNNDIASETSKLITDETKET
jgi:hypothetical protein